MHASLFILLGCNLFLFLKYKNTQKKYLKETILSKQHEIRAHKLYLFIKNQKIENNNSLKTSQIGINKTLSNIKISLTELCDIQFLKQQESLKKITLMLNKEKELIQAKLNHEIYFIKQKFDEIEFVLEKNIKEKFQNQLNILFKKTFYEEKNYKTDATKLAYSVVFLTTINYLLSMGIEKSCINEFEEIFLKNEFFIYQENKSIINFSDIDLNKIIPQIENDSKISLNLKFDTSKDE